MGKIKNFFYTQRTKIGEVGRKYLVTLCLIFILCIYWDFLEIAKITVARNEEYILIFLVMAIVGTFFTESVLRGRKSKEAAITGYVVSGLGAFLWVILYVISQTEISDISRYYIYACAGMYILTLPGLSLLALVKDSNLTFEQYVLRVVISLMRLLLIFAVLNIGILLILWLFDTLITKIFIFTWLGYVEIFLLSVIYVPYFFSCLINQSEPEQNRFSRGMVLYALMPMLIAAMVIIYIYMIRLLFTWDFPSNQLFMICASVFLIGWLIWTMAYAYTRRDRTPIYNKLIRYMKYFYAPLVLLECYAVGIRISDYGLTFSRMLGIAFITLQVIYIAWEPIINLIRLIARKDKVHYAEHYEWILFAVFGIYFISALVPWTSFEYLEASSQEARFDETWEGMQKMRSLDRQWTPEEYQEVARLQYSGKSIRSVLNSNLYGNQYLKMNYSDAEMEEVLNMDDTWWTSEKVVVPEQEPIVDEWSVSQYLSGGMDILSDGLKIDAYSRLYEATMYSAYDQPMEWSELKTIEIQYGVEQTTKVDLTNCVEQMIHLYEEAVAKQLMPENNTEEEKGRHPDENSADRPKEVSVEEMEAIYQIPVGGGVYTITQISFRYNPATNQIRNLTLAGYLLFP